MTTPSRWIAWAAAGGAVALLSGCVVAPIGPPPPRPVAVYPAPGYGYGPPPVVVVPAPPPRPYPYRRWRDRY
ncbi:MAG: hypothetical protein J0H69_00970 [Burkholderiales bacterium]|nr:hypothetical protein [Burkholderiales bacterium]